MRLLKNKGLRGSMGRVGSSGDNAAMESFFSLLQKNVLDTHRWDSREELRLAIVSWIDTKYDRRRRQRALGKSGGVALGLVMSQFPEAMTARACLDLDGKVFSSPLRTLTRERADRTTGEL